MLQLAGALAAPVIGAVLYGWLHDRPGAVRIFDSVMYVAVPALVAWQVLPNAWAEYGVLAILVLAAGMGTPALIERTSHALAPHTDNLALVGGLSGIALHAFLEGAALTPNGASVTAAVILHRIPVGLVIWWMLRPRHGFLVGPRSALARSPSPRRPATRSALGWSTIPAAAWSSIRRSSAGRCCTSCFTRAATTTGTSTTEARRWRPARRPADAHRTRREVPAARLGRRCVYPPVSKIHMSLLSIGQQCGAFASSR